MPEYRKITAGDPAPMFRQRTTDNPTYSFDSMGGRYIVLCFYGSAGDSVGAGMLDILTEHRNLFDDVKVAFCGVSIDPADENEKRVRDLIPGARHFWDFDGAVSRLYGAIPADAKTGEAVVLRRLWVILDPTLRVRAVFELKPDGSDRHLVAGYLQGLPPVDHNAGFRVDAPILILPQVFEPELCQRLMNLYERDGGQDSGFMREVDGKTVGVYDYSYKRRADHTIEDEPLKKLLQQKIVRRVVPEIEKVHQYKVTRMERYIVACYDGATGGHFRPHRDNTTKGTAHRRFAMSVNLNDDFDGGEVGFPEYGPRTYKAPAGGAVVFSCSLLHSVSAVRRGRRFAFLPFLYDDAAAAVREANNKYLDQNTGQYRSNG